MNVLIYMGAILNPNVKLIGLKLVFTRMYKTPKGEELGEDVYSKACHCLMIIGGFMLLSLLITVRQLLLVDLLLHNLPILTSKRILKTK